MNTEAPRNDFTYLIEAFNRAFAGGADDATKDAAWDWLASEWENLSGSDAESMDGYKLQDREVELPTWNPPVLTFQIERHGATVRGSIYAEMHEWTVDFTRGTASCAFAYRRQVAPASPRQNMKSEAQRLADAIVGGHDDPWLQWKPDRHCVKVLVADIVPDDSCVKQTLVGRRRRLHDRLCERLSPQHWRCGSGGGAWHFRRAQPPARA